MKLELGKRYVCKNGQVTGQLTSSSEFHNYPFSDPPTGALFTEDGFYYLDKGPSQYNLIEEYIKPSSLQKKSLNFLEAWQAAKAGKSIKGSRCTYVMSSQEVLNCFNWGDEDFEDVYEVFDPPEETMYTTYHTVYKGLTDDKPKIIVGIGHSTAESALENLQFMPAISVVAIQVDSKGNFIKGATLKTAEDRNLDLV